MAWRMAISEGGVITGFLTCVEIGSASCSGGMRGWRYIEWQYNKGTLYMNFYYVAMLSLPKGLKTPSFGNELQ
jgi:hypothetical protein